MASKTSFDLEKIWKILSEIPDPEIPVLSITELGVVRAVEMEGETMVVSITPTYTGCPAMPLFETDIQKVLKINGFDKVKVKTVYQPAWTTDWLSDAAKEKLKKYGIAPPVKSKRDESELFSDESVKVPCPHCGSDNTSLKSQFGSTACKALYTCNNCLEPFEYFKCL